MIDLSSNENPYPPSEKAVKAASESLGQLNRYVAREEFCALRKALAEYCSVGEGRILVGPGTNYLLGKAVCRFAGGRDVVVLNPTIFGCVEGARHVGGRVLRMQMTPPGFEIDWSGLGGRSCLILIDQPNNPSGQCLIDRVQLKGLLENGDKLVIVDEAGYEYCAKTFVDLVADYPNLAVTRTLDKAFGLAGMRVSWMVAGDTFLTALDSNDILINRPACAAALAALEDKAYALGCVSMTVSERDRLAFGLAELGLEVFPSEANFLLVRTVIPDFALYLRKAGFFVGDLSISWLPGFYRISVGSREENNALMKVIEKSSERA